MISSIKISIDFTDNREFYTNGDVIHGKAIVESSKAFSTQKIVMKMRCEEFAYVWVPNGQGGYYEIENHRHLSLSTTVFPSKTIRNQNEISNQKYTLQAGKHEFAFKFKVPLANLYPQTLKIPGSDSGIKWYIKCNLHRGNLVSSIKRQAREFTMIPNSTTRCNMQELVNYNSETKIQCYKQGYAELSKTPSGKLKSLLPRNQNFRVKTQVSLQLTVPDCGLHQQPSLLNLNLDVSCQDEELLVFKRLELVLKQKIVVSVNNGWNTSVYRANFVVCAFDMPNLAMKPALAEIQKNLQHAVIEGPLPESFNNLNFDLTYKLAAELTIGSREKPSNMEKARISVPVYLHGYSSYNMEALSLEEDELPFYSAKPQEGEAIIN